MWPSSFYRWVAMPGTYTITSSEGRFNAYIKLQLETGKVYFVQNWTAGGFGITTDTGLQLVDDDTGRQLVKSGRMIWRGRVLRPWWVMRDGECERPVTHPPITHHPTLITRYPSRVGAIRQ